MSSMCAAPLESGPHRGDRCTAYATTHGYCGRHLKWSVRELEDHLDDATDAQYECAVGDAEELAGFELRVEELKAQLANEKNKRKRAQRRHKRASHGLADMADTCNDAVSLIYQLTDALEVEQRDADCIARELELNDNRRREKEAKLEGEMQILLHQLHAVATQHASRGTPQRSGFKGHGDLGADARTRRRDAGRKRTRENRAASIAARRAAHATK